MGSRCWNSRIFVPRCRNGILIFMKDVLIIAIKGTSLATPVGSGPTSKSDKLNDNMMFSCCCAKAGWEWTPICSCPISKTECSKSCLLRESSFDGSYYNLAQTIYLAVKEWFPKHTSIWMTGHSLGGALAGLVALTNDIPGIYNLTKHLHSRLLEICCMLRDWGWFNFH